MGKKDKLVISKVCNGFIVHPHTEAVLRPKPKAAKRKK
jgi:hypothetical protein